LEDHIGGGLVFVSGATEAERDTGFQEKGQAMLTGCYYYGLVKGAAIRLTLSGELASRRVGEQCGCNTAR
jgi:hypothetical protein